jgi:hypothetical protein
VRELLTIWYGVPVVTVFLWTVLPAPWKYYAVVLPFAGFFAMRRVRRGRRR